MRSAAAEAAAARVERAAAGGVWIRAPKMPKDIRGALERNSGAVVSFFLLLLLLLLLKVCKQMGPRMVRT